MPEPSRRTRIYVNYSTTDIGDKARELRGALEQAGFQLASAQAGEWWGNYDQPLDADGAVLIVSAASLKSAGIAGVERDAIARLASQRFPVIFLIHDDMSAEQLMSYPLARNATAPASSASDFGDRVTETIAALDRLFAEKTALPVAGSYTTTKLITVGGSVTAVAIAEMRGRLVAAVASETEAMQLWALDDSAGTEPILRDGSRPVRSVAFGSFGRHTAVVSGGTTGVIKVLRASSGIHQDTMTGPVHAAQSVVMGHTGTASIVAGGFDASVTTVWHDWESTHETRRELDSVMAANGVALVDPARARMLVAACADGTVRTVDLRSAAGEETVRELTGHSGPATSIAVVESTAFSGGLDGTVRAWNVDTGKEITKFEVPGTSIRTVAAESVDGVVHVVCGGDDTAVRLWLPDSGSSVTLHGHTGPVTSVAVTVHNGSLVIASGSTDQTVRIWTGTADQVEWLADKPSTEDLLRRRPLARAIAVRLRRMDEQEPGTSFLAHIDGPWGAGKSTMVNFLRDELEPGFTTVHFDAWREKGVGPAWWALLTALRTAIRKQRRWYSRIGLRIAEPFARLRRVGAPFVLALALILALGGGILWLFGLQDVAKAITGSLAAVGTIWAGALVASRFLLWDSARGARLFEQSNSNPMLEVERHFAWLMAKSRKPVVFFVDDLDRCPDAYVVELLDTVQTLIRNTGPRAAHFMVAADGTWIRTSYELAHERFAEAVAVPGRPLGYLFLDKFFQLRIPVPAMDTVRQEHYLRELLKGPAPRQQVDAEEARVREQLGHSVTEAQVVATFQAASPEVRNRVAAAALERLTTPEAIAATEHSLQRFAGLLPANPRTMKRFVNAYSALRAVRTLEANAVRVESLALWTIIEIRWPSLADHLRTRPESIDLLGLPAEDLTAVPEALHPLFSDPALRAIVEFDKSTPFDAELIRLCSGG